MRAYLPLVNLDLAITRLIRTFRGAVRLAASGTRLLARAFHFASMTSSTSIHTLRLGRSSEMFTLRDRLFLWPLRGIAPAQWCAKTFILAFRHTVDILPQSVPSFFGIWTRIFFGRFSSRYLLLVGLQTCRPSLLGISSRNAVTLALKHFSNGVIVQKSFCSPLGENLLRRNKTLERSSLYITQIDDEAVS